MNQFTVVTDPIDLSGPLTEPVALRLHLDGQAEAFVSLDGVAPLAPILRKLAAQVLDSLDLFYDCFIGVCPHTSGPPRPRAAATLTP